MSSYGYSSSFLYAVATILEFSCAIAPCFASPPCILLPWTNMLHAQHCVCLPLFPQSHLLMSHSCHTNHIFFSPLFLLLFTQLILPVIQQWPVPQSQAHSQVMCSFHLILVCAPRCPSKRDGYKPWQDKGFTLFSKCQTA